MIYKWCFSPLKRICSLFDDCCAIGCAGRCHFDNSQYSPWQIIPLKSFQCIMVLLQFHASFWRHFVIGGTKRCQSVTTVPSTWRLYNGNPILVRRHLSIEMAPGNTSTARNILSCAIRNELCFFLPKQSIKNDIWGNDFLYFHRKSTWRVGIISLILNITLVNTRV